MIKRPFICLTKPKINYELIGGKLSAPEEIPLPKTVTLLVDTPYENTNTQVKAGDAVKTGQKITLGEDATAYAVSSVTGTIKTMAPFFGDYGKRMTAITIEASAAEEVDDTFAGLKENVSLEALVENLAFCPGAPDLDALCDAERPIRTIVVYGGNTDLLIGTNQYVVRTMTEDIKAGIEILKKATEADVIIVIPRDLTPGFGHIGADYKGVDLAYPSGMPKMIMDKVLGQPVPAGKACEDLGVTFMPAEAVAAIERRLPQARCPTAKSSHW